MNLDVPIQEKLEDAIDPARAALLVIDVQNDLCRGDAQVILPRLQRLLAVSRETGVFSVYMQNTMTVDGSSQSSSEIARRKKWGMRPQVTVDGTLGQQIIEQIAPRPTDPIVRKHRMSAFHGTSLDLLLRNRRIETVICTGVATQGCVLSTAYSALARDFYVVVVEDCVASGSQECHDLSLTLMKKVLHYVVDSEQIIRIWQSEGSRLQTAGERAFV